VFPKTIPEVSLETQQLIARLNTVGVGEVILYADLSKIVDGDIQTEKYHFLVTAKRRLLIDSHKVFEAVKGVGVARLPDAEIVETSKGIVWKIRRITKTAIQKLSCVNFDELSNEHKIKHNTNMSLLAAVHQFSKPKQLKTLEGMVATANRKLEIGTTLEMFK
jgi:hypothetical protein